MRCALIITIILLSYSSCSWCDEGLNNTTEPRGKVSGRYHTVQTMVAKVIGAEGLSEELLKFIREGSNDTAIPENATLVIGAHGSGIPELVTESVKTVAKTISIPLSLDFMTNEWYRDTLKKFLLKHKIGLLSSATNTEEHGEKTGTDAIKVSYKLFAAAKFRDNIIFAFEHVLYHRERIIPRDLHESLNQILHALLLRQVPILDSTEFIAATMTPENSHEQFIYLFERLENLVPKHIRSSITYWLECLYNNKINMNYYHNLNLLSGTENYPQELIRTKLSFPESIIKKSTRSNEDLFGKTLSYILAAVSGKSLPLTSQVFAGILSHLPSNSLLPEIEEYKGFLIDYLKQDNGNVFSSALENINFEELNNPFLLVRKVLQVLMEKEFFSEKKILESILIETEEKDPSLLDDYQVKLSILMSQPTDVKILLEAIVNRGYSPVAVDAKNRIINHINSNVVNFQTIQHEFNRNAYLNPQDLLVAILTRISVRGNRLNDEIRKDAEILKAYILLQDPLNRLRFALDIQDAITLLTFFQGSYMFPEIRTCANDLKLILNQEKLKLQNHLMGYRIEQCNGPKGCILNIFNLIISKGMNETLSLKMKEFINMANQLTLD